MLSFLQKYLGYPERPPLGCSIRMANHSRSPNCRVVPYEPEYCKNDLVLMVLVTMRDVVSNETITFQYRGCMW
jgi:hypothetical protein